MQALSPCTVYSVLRLVSRDWRNAVAATPLNLPANLTMHLVSAPILTSSSSSRDSQSPIRPLSMQGTGASVSGAACSQCDAAPLEEQQHRGTSNAFLSIGAEVDPVSMGFARGEGLRSVDRRTFVDSECERQRGWRSQGANTDMQQLRRTRLRRTQSERLRTVLRLQLPLSQLDDAAALREGGCSYVYDGDARGNPGNGSSDSNSGSSSGSSSSHPVTAVQSLLRSAARCQLPAAVCSNINVAVDRICIEEMLAGNAGASEDSHAGGGADGATVGGAYSGSVGGVGNGVAIVSGSPAVARLEHLLCALQPRSVRIVRVCLPLRQWLPSSLTVLELTRCVFSEGADTTASALGTSSLLAVAPRRPHHLTTASAAKEDQHLELEHVSQRLTLPTSLESLHWGRNHGMRNDVLLHAISQLRGLRTLSLQLTPQWAMEPDDTVDFRWLLPLQQLEDFTLWSTDMVTGALPRVLAQMPSLRRVQVDWLQWRDISQTDVLALLTALPLLESFGTLRYATEQFWRRLPHFGQRRVSPWDARPCGGSAAGGGGGAAGAAATGSGARITVVPAPAAITPQSQLGQLRQLALFDSDCEPQDLRALVNGVIERLPNLQTLTLTVDNCYAGGANSGNAALAHVGGQGGSDGEGSGSGSDSENNDAGSELVTAKFMLHCLGRLRLWGQRHGKSDAAVPQRVLRFCANSEFCKHEDSGIARTSLFSGAMYSHRPGTLAHADFFEALQLRLGEVRLELFHQ